MKPVSIFKKNYHVELRDVDFTRRLKLSTLFNYLQEISSQHLENLGIGIEAIEKRCRAAWILMRAKARITRLPAWNEDLTIETWQQKPKKFEFERDYIVRDAAGEAIIRAVTVWTIIDIQTRKLKNTAAIAVEHPPFICARALPDCRMVKIKPVDSPQIAYRKTICYSDTDINGHLNNGKYIDFAADCFPIEKHRLYDIKAIQINYVREALPGDNIALCTWTAGPAAGTVYIGGIEESGCPVFNAVVEIVPVEERPEILPAEKTGSKQNREKA